VKAFCLPRATNVSEGTDMNNPIQKGPEVQRRKGFCIASFVLQIGLAAALSKGFVLR
jgi:hypothetical protein